MTSNLIDILYRAALRLHEARAILAHADADLIESKARLAAAERRLDEATIRLQADAPREKATNEVQRRAYAILGAADEAAAVEALREAHTAGEVRHVRARAAVRAAEDMVRYHEMLISAASLPEDLYVPPLPETVFA
jgi:hypothetical protein